ncbi:hypothetical protein [Agrobacterium larrymoorei]|uniref:Uncharacterized protein n=1 Tax=Agrobacterium larrymoorei TaxID=160699 RepID=A0AAF0HCU9_9HYPH|nr:hypothetical protein [Agrobacterium larrymoorei]WHA41973.1 hypothetical protein CFBP5477_004905 [Agrobacterium larrymoorei]
MLKALEVIWIYDNLIEPPHPKMVVCVQPDEGLFYRINSRPFLKPCIPLVRDPDHPWLDHDSFLHIDPLMLDDFIVKHAVERGGVIGVVQANLSSQIKRLTLGLNYLTLEEKQSICFALP